MFWLDLYSLHFSVKIHLFFVSKVVPGRMGLLVTLFLSLTALLVSTITSSPEVTHSMLALLALLACIALRWPSSLFNTRYNYNLKWSWPFQASVGVTALAFWVLVHFFFIFGAIVVYMLQLVLVRTANQYEEGDMKDVNVNTRAWKIDKSMLLLFPSLYILFNLIYWLVCLSGQWWLWTEINCFVELCFKVIHWYLPPSCDIHVTKINNHDSMRQCLASYWIRKIPVISCGSTKGSPLF